MEVFGVVYLIWCTVNGKRYVGQTTQPLKKRFQKFTADEIKKLEEIFGKAAAYLLQRFD